MTDDGRYDKCHICQSEMISCACDEQPDFSCANCEDRGFLFDGTECAFCPESLFLYMEAKNEMRLVNARS